MTALNIGAIFFACCFGAGCIGLLLRGVVPEHHLDSESKDTVKLVMGLIATLTALVLGLLIASAKSSYDAQQTGLEQLATDVIELDYRLASIGPETKDIRQGIHTAMAGLHDRIWSSEGASTETIDPKASAGVYDSILGAIRTLPAKTDAQQSD